MISVEVKVRKVDTHYGRCFSLSTNENATQEVTSEGRSYFRTGRKQTAGCENKQKF